VHWIAPTEKDSASASLEKRLWDAADQFRANSGLKAQGYSGPSLGLIFLRFAEARFAEVRFAAQRAKLEKAGGSSRRGSRLDEPAAYQWPATHRNKRNSGGDNSYSATRYCPFRNSNHSRTCY
jgi:type I restriction enzyme M protein